MADLRRRGAEAHLISLTPTEAQMFLSARDVQGGRRSLVLAHDGADGRRQPLPGALAAVALPSEGLRGSLHGSLAFTGVGHATDRATIPGLGGVRACHL